MSDFINVYSDNESVTSVKSINSEESNDSCDTIVSVASSTISIQDLLETYNDEKSIHGKIIVIFFFILFVLFFLTKIDFFN